MKPIAIFRSNSFDLSFPRNGRDPNEPPRGKDVAEYLKRKFQDLGFTTSVPIQGDFYWMLEVAGDGARLWFLVYWAALDEPPEDWWVVKPKLKDGILKRLFRNPTTHNEILLALEVLQKVLKDSPNIVDLQWLDEKELEARY